MAHNLIINGVTLPLTTKDGYELTIDKVMSKNSGMMANGTNRGTLIGYRTTIKATWDITHGDIANSISNAIFNSTGQLIVSDYTGRDGNAGYGGIFEITGNVSFPFYNMNKRLCQGITITLTEVNVH